MGSEKRMMCEFVQEGVKITYLNNMNCNWAFAYSVIGLFLFWCGLAALLIYIIYRIDKWKTNVDKKLKNIK